MSEKRCPKCCDILGYPHGTGSPKNDDSCREVVEKRLGHKLPTLEEIKANVKRYTGIQNEAEVHQGGTDA